MRPHRKARLFSVDRRAVQFDRAQDRGLADRHQAALPRQPEQQRVHRLRVAEQALGQAHARAARPERLASVTRSMVRRCSAASIDRFASCLNSAVAARSRLPITAGDCARCAPARRARRRPRDRPPASGPRCRAECARRPARLVVGDLHMRDDGAVLLRQPGEVQGLDLPCLPDAPPSPGSRRR